MVNVPRVLGVVWPFRCSKFQRQRRGRAIRRACAQPTQPLGESIPLVFERLGVVPEKGREIGPCAGMAPRAGYRHVAQGWPAKGTGILGAVCDPHSPDIVRLGLEPLGRVRAKLWLSNPVKAVIGLQLARMVGGAARLRNVVILRMSRHLVGRERREHLGVIVPPVGSKPAPPSPRPVESPSEASNCG